MKSIPLSSTLTIPTIPVLPISVVAQKDAVSCGLCSLLAVTRHFDIDCKEEVLRAVLGVDNSLPAILPLRHRIESLLRKRDISFLEGTSPWDMGAALSRLGFGYELTWQNDGDLIEKLGRSLNKGFPILTHIHVEKADHWVVVNGIESKGIWVVDSNAEESDRWNWEYFFGKFYVGFCLNAYTPPRRGPFRPMGLLDYARDYGRVTRVYSRRSSGGRWAGNQWH